MKVFAFHDGHACGYYRVTLPLDAMAALGGHEVYTRVGWDERCHEYPLIVGQRLGRIEAMPMWRRLSLRHRLIYEIDDDIWRIHPQNYGAVKAHTLEAVAAHEDLIRYSHLVTVTTEALAEVVRRFNPNVVVLPNHLDGKILELVRPHRDKLVLGWAGGDSHLPDLLTLADVLPRFLRRNPQVEFHNVGTDFRRILKVEGRFTDWQADLFDYYRALDFDIGIAPLANIEFNRSKSAIKALEYMALGIPVVASDIEPYRLIQHGVTGFLVRHEHEWAKYLYELAQDRDLREAMGQAARRYVAENWQIQKGWRLWEAAYSTLGLPAGWRNSDEQDGVHEGPDLGHGERRGMARAG